MENSQVAHKIKQRKSPKDVFITPPGLALHHIKYSLGDDIGDDLLRNRNITILDPCCHERYGSYIKHMEDFNFNFDYCEITMNKDFFKYEGREDGLNLYAIIGNPPYSMLDKWFKKSVELKPVIISYLIGQGNITAKRIEFMNKHGYSLVKCKMLKVYKWYGMSYIVHFERQPFIDNCIDIEDVRNVWK